MPIDRDLAVNTPMEPSAGYWTKDDVILYHLGIGAGVPATDPNELEYTFEKNLKVLPSFPVVSGKNSTSGGGGLLKHPGLEFNPALLLHGEQDVEIHRPLPVATKFTQQSRIADIFDKGKAALAILENTAKDEDGNDLFTSRMSLFLRGEGGFGGEPGPKVGNAAPEREPDGVVEKATLPQAALIYRLCGDKNPLHADPEFAKMGGFDKPIIHGLLSYGLTCKAVVDDALGGDVNRVARYQARFAGVGFPGETYLVSYWNEGDKILIEAKSKERDAVIISNAAITLRS